MESRRTPGPARLAHHDAVLGTLRAGGFSLAATAHAYALRPGYSFATSFDVGLELVLDGLGTLRGAR